MGPKQHPKRDTEKRTLGGRTSQAGGIVEEPETREGDKQELRKESWSPPVKRFRLYSINDRKQLKVKQSRDRIKQNLMKINFSGSAGCYR